MVASEQFLLNKRHYGNVVLDDSPDATFKHTKTELDPIKDGQILAQVLYLSNDPAQRGWISPGTAKYSAPVLEGDVMRAQGIAKVTDSKSSKYSIGDYIVGMVGWTQYTILNETDFIQKVSDDLPLTAYLSVAGMTGLTAYFGLTKVGGAKKDQVVLVSGAAGATGSVVVQLAKHVIGAKKVIGIAGGSAKVDFVKSLGADYAVDYKSSTFAKDLQDALGDDKFDLFFDNIGGSILDLGLSLMTVGGTVVACGSISGYNDTTQSDVKHWGYITTNRLHIHGFIIVDFLKDYVNGINELVEFIKNGKLSLKNSFTLVDVTDDFKKVPETWTGLFRGVNTGKLITQVAKN